MSLSRKPPYQAEVRALNWRQLKMELDGMACHLVPAHELQVVTSGISTYLRFSVTTWNSGLGPLELLPGPGSGSTQIIYQRVYLADGGFSDKIAGSFIWQHIPRGGTYKVYIAKPLDLEPFIGCQILKLLKRGRNIPGAL